ncbi:hypothetical protein NQZ68_027474 [Dissostichus eleginoides]|nr:hypothetical protein NQZ68_027474 [Dissostichus eleginoides]
MFDKSRRVTLSFHINTTKAESIERATERQSSTDTRDKKLKNYERRTRGGNTEKRTCFFEAARRAGTDQIMRRLIKVTNRRTVLTVH